MNLPKKVTNIYIGILIFLLILIPKKYSMLFGLPLRMILLSILPIIFLIELKLKKIKLNNFNILFFIIPYSLFLLFSIPSIFYSKNIIITIYTICKFLIFGINFLILLKLKFEKRDYINFINILIISATLVAIYSIYQYINFKDLNYNGTEKYHGINGRTIATFFNPIYYGIFINIIFFFLPYIIKEKIVNNKCIYILLHILPIILYIGFVLTFTRSILLVFGGMIVIILILNYRIILNIKTLIILIICFFIQINIPGANYVLKSAAYYGFEMTKINDLYNMISSSKDKKLIFGNDINKEIYEEDSSVEHRKDFANIGIEIANKFPLTGVGMGAYIDYMYSPTFNINHPEYNKIKDYPHAGFIMLASEGGYIATSFFLISLFIILMQIVINIKNNFKIKNLCLNLNIILFAVYIGFFITTVVAENPIYDSQLFPLFLIFTAFILNFSNQNKNEMLV